MTTKNPEIHGTVTIPPVDHESARVHALQRIAAACEGIEAQLSMIGSGILAPGQTGISTFAENLAKGIKAGLSGNV